MKDIHSMKNPTRRRDPEAKRAALHSSAFALLAARSYDAVPVSMIAAEADVAVGTFYRFYPTKMALLEAMSDALEKDFVTAMWEAWDKQVDYKSKIGALAESLFDTITRHATEIGVMEMTAGHRAAASKSLGDLIRNAVALIYTDGQKNGGFLPYDTQMFSAAAHGMVEGLMRRYLTNPTDAKRQEYSAFLTALLSKLLI
jgi:AcrR family transcriptional regulator